MTPIQHRVAKPLLIWVRQFPIDSPLRKPVIEAMDAWNVRGDIKPMVRLVRELGLEVDSP